MPAQLARLGDTRVKLLAAYVLSLGSAPQAGAARPMSARRPLSRRTDDRELTLGGRARAVARSPGRRSWRPAWHHVVLRLRRSAGAGSATTRRMVAHRRAGVYALGFFVFWCLARWSRAGALPAGSCRGDDRPATHGRNVNAHVRRAGGSGQLAVRRAPEDLPARDRGALRAAAHARRSGCCSASSTCCPGCEWHGRQAVLFDLPARKFYIFGLMFWPQDFIFLDLAADHRRAVAVLLHRAGGPAVVRLRLPADGLDRSVPVDGAPAPKATRSARMKLDRGAVDADKLLRKGAKQVLWIGFALWTGFTFVGFFSPIRDAGARRAGAVARALGNLLGPVLRLRHLRQRRLPARAGLQVHVPVRALPERDVRPDTLIITYDAQRGEPRGARKRGTDPQRAGPRRLHRLHLVRAGLPDRHRHPQGPADTSASPARPASTPATTSWTRWAIRAG